MTTSTTRKIVVVGVLLAMGVGFIGATLQPLFATKAETPPSGQIPFVLEYPPVAAQNSTSANSPAANGPAEMPNPFPTLGPQAQQP